jgi:hypothetical protein
MPTKISVSFFIDIEKPILKFIWKNKRPWIAKVILSKKSTAGGIIILSFKLYHRAVVIKIAMVLAQKQTWRPVEQKRKNRNKMTLYSKLIFDKGAKSIVYFSSGRKNSFFNKWYREYWLSMCKRLKLDTYLSPV